MLAVTTFGQSHGTNADGYEPISANIDGDRFTANMLPVDYSVGRTTT